MLSAAVQPRMQLKGGNSWHRVVVVQPFNQDFQTLVATYGVISATAARATSHCRLVSGGTSVPTSASHLRATSVYESSVWIKLLMVRVANF
jgi:hypothetical protein